MTIMELKINGKTRELADGATVSDAVAEAGVAPDASGVAVAVNDAVVPRAQWSATPLRSGDFVEIIHAVAGG